jgi:hypothetical protein
LKWGLVDALILRISGALQARYARSCGPNGSMERANKGLKSHVAPHQGGKIHIVLTKNEALNVGFWAC